MSSPLRVIADTKRLEETMKALDHVPEKAKIALARSINKAALSARTEVVRKARARFQIQANRARSTIHISKASSSADMPTAFVVSKEERQQIIRFRVSPKDPRPQKGLNNIQKKAMPKVRVSVTRGKSTPFKHAFVARLRSGHVGLFMRLKGEKTETGKTKLHEHYGPAVPQMIGGKTGAEAVAELASKKFFDEFDRQADLVFKE